MRLRDLSANHAKENWRKAQEGAVRTIRFRSICLWRFNKFWPKRSKVDLQLDVGKNIRSWPCMMAVEIS